MNKIVIFGIGVLVGAAAGAGITYLCMKDNVKTVNVETAPQDYKDAVRTDPEELREYYIQQLIDLGFEVREEEVNEDNYDDYIFEKETTSRVNPLEEEEDEEDADDLSPIEPNPEPYEIQGRDLGQIESYDCETINWYKGDHTMCDENYDLIDNWQQHIGHIEDRLMKENEDSIYIRNEMQQTDYEVLIYEDSYKHAVEGEDPEELGDMAD